MASPIKRVPQARVGEVVQSFIDFDNATEVHASQAGDGTFTVTPLGVAADVTTMLHFTGATMKKATAKKAERPTASRSNAPRPRRADNT